MSSSKLRRDKAKLSKDRKTRRMSGTYKAYDQKIFDEYNNPAITIVLEYLDSQGVWAAPNDDKYGPDIVAFRGFTPSSYIEVEVKQAWKPEHEIFPYPTVQLPERKSKFLGLGLTCEFWVLKSTMDYAMILPDYLVSSSPLVEVPNRYIESGEKFFQVPVSECSMVHLLPDSEEASSDEEETEKDTAP